MSIQIRVAGLFASAIVASAATAQTAVEWKVSDGGNGHWYEVSTGSLLWNAAKLQAEARGGHLATISDLSENTFVELVIDASGEGNALWLGAYKSPGLAWCWVDASAFTFADWGTAECSSGPYPNNPPSQPVVMSISRCSYGNRATRLVWDDQSITDPSARSVLEWDADCNGDGIVDYGQILRGELIDLNANGVPDICETSISSVIPPSVPSQGGSTITIRGNFPPNPTVKVGGVVATNVSRTSITQITATVPELLPGMASVQVNDFTLPDAIYIRPECGSDLDQNGTVDTADISIILLDFGPCYEPPAALAAPAPTPLLVDEPAQKPVHR